MKRIKTALLAMLAVCLLCAMPVAASDCRVFDDCGVFKNVNALLELEEEVYANTGVAICIASFPGVMTEDEMHDYCKEYCPLPNGAFLLICPDDSTFMVYTMGTADAIFEYDGYDLLKYSYRDAPTRQQGAEDFCRMVNDLMLEINSGNAAEVTAPVAPAVPDAGTQRDIPLISTQTTGAGVIPVDRTMPLVVDEGGYLTEEDYLKLNAYAEQIAANYPYEVAVAFVRDLNGMDVMDYADDFYDYNGYGAGADHDGILLLVCPESRDYWMTAGGQGMQMFDDDRMEAADESVVPYLANGDWAGAADEFLWICERQLSQGMPEPPSRSVSPVWILIDAALGFLGGAIPVSAMKSQLKSVAAKREASHWVDEDGLVLTASRDRVKGTHYLRRQIPQQRSGGSGGGGHSSHAHVSSSGQTHTGRGGKF